MADELETNTTEDTAKDKPTTKAKPDPVQAICDLCKGMTQAEASHTLRTAWKRIKA